MLNVFLIEHSSLVFPRRTAVTKSWMATWGLGLGTRGCETQGRETRRRETQGRGTREGETRRRGTRGRGTRGRGTRGRGRGNSETHGTRERDKQTTPDICADFVEYNFRWSR